MIIGYLIGFLITMSAVSLVSALLISLGSRIIAKRSIPLKQGFGISFLAFLITYAAQWMFVSFLHMEHTPLAALPGLAFFLVSWAGITQVTGENVESGMGSVVRGLLIALIQCGSLILIGVFIAFVLMGMLRPASP